MGVRLTAALLAISLVLVPTAVAASPGVRLATAILRNASGDIVGAAWFRENAHGEVHVGVVAFGLTHGLHGLHIHGIGLCTGPDFTSAGPHFNPLGLKHGSHAGDLPNLPVGPGGVGHLRTATTRFTLSPGTLSIFDNDGAALVVHRDTDDYVTNPTGNAGPRIACGVISHSGS